MQNQLGAIERLKEALATAAKRDAKLRQAAQEVNETLVGLILVTVLGFTNGKIEEAEEEPVPSHGANLDTYQMEQYKRLDVACGLLEATSPVLSEAEEKYFAKLKALTSQLGQLQSNLTTVRRSRKLRWRLSARRAFPVPPLLYLRACRAL